MYDPVSLCFLGNLLTLVDLVEQFLCDKCPNSEIPLVGAKRFEQHFLSHPLVQCKRRVEDPEEPSEQDRIVALHHRSTQLAIDIRSLNEKVREMHQVLVSRKAPS